MSERGTFITSFLYDWHMLQPILQALQQNARYLLPIAADHYVIAGVLHGTWSSEEAWEFENETSELISMALPEKHGQFSVVVMPESEEYTVVFTWNADSREPVVRRVPKEASPP